MYGVPMAAAYYGQSGLAYASSPATAATATTPEYRRGLQRSSATTESGASTSGSSLRSQSQPASRSAPATQQGQGFPGTSTPTNGGANPARQVNGVPIPSFIPGDAVYDEAPQHPASKSPASDEGAYLGYYVSDTSSPARSQGPPNAIAFGDSTQPAQGRRRLSTEVPQTILDRRMRRTSRSPSPLGHARAFSTGGTAAAPGQATTAVNPNGPRTASRPLVVNGTGSSLRTSSTPLQRHDPTGLAADPNTDESRRLSQEQSLQVQGLGISGHAVDQGDVQSSTRPEPAQTPVSERTPLIVNGTTTPTATNAAAAAALTSPSAPRPVDDPSFRDRIALMSMNQYAWASQTQVQPEVVNGTQTSLRQRALSRQQSGVIAPLDLATRDNRMNSHQLSIDAQHLSPINETRSPSPTVIRKGDYPPRADQSSSVAQNATPKVQTDPLVPGRKENETKGSTANQPKQAHTSAQSPKRLSAATQRSPQAATQPQSHSQTSGQAPAQSPRVNGIRENGHTRGVKSESHGADGTWQKATKSRKKGADVKNLGSGLVSGEQPPKHEADRKGG